MNHNRTYPFDRLAAGLEETRHDLGLTRAATAKLAGLSENMVYRLERGKCRNWLSVVKLRTALTMVELSAPPEERDLIEDLVVRSAGGARDRQFPAGVSS